MSPESLRLRWRCLASGRVCEHTFEPDGGDWTLTTYAAGRATGTVAVTALDAEVVGETPRPETTVVTWAEGDIRRRMTLEACRDGAWARTPELDGHECATEHVDGLRVDLCTRTGLTHVGP